MPLEPPPRETELEDILNAFCDDVEAAGGVRRNAEGFVHPKDDDNWTDLGSTYLDACRVLGRTPEINEDSDEGWDSDLDRPDPADGDITGEFEIPKDA